MAMLDPQAREAARIWAIEATSDGGVPGDDYIDGILSSYLSALTPAEAGGLVERLNLPWPPDGSGDEVTLPVWVIELMTEAATALETKDAEIEAKGAEIDRLKRGLMGAAMFASPKDALASERAAHAETKRERDLMAREWCDFCEAMGVSVDMQEVVAVVLQARQERTEAQRDEALKALVEARAFINAYAGGNEPGRAWTIITLEEIDDVIAALRVREGGKADG